MSTKFRQISTAVLFAGLLELVQTAEAARTWVGGGANANINETTNWLGGTLPSLNTNSVNADVIFSGTATNNITMINAFVYNPLWRNVTFDASAGPFVFSRDSTPTGPGVTYDFHFNWSSGATTSANNSTNPQTFNLDNIYFRKGKINAAAGDFIFNGVLNVGANVAVNTVNGINFDGANNFYVNNGFVGNTGSRLDKNGAGTVFLGECPVDAINVDNSATPTPSGRWGGQLSIFAGTVEISNSLSLGEQGSLADVTKYWTEVRGTGNLTFNSQSKTSTGGGYVTTGNITVGELVYSAGRGTYSPQVSNKTGTNTFSGILLTENAPGANINSFQSDGTAAGDKFVISGDLRQTSPDASILSLQGAGSGEITGTITQDAGAWSLEKNGAGTWKIRSNQTYTGTTAVNAGTLLINGMHSGGGTYSVSAGATLGGNGTVDVGGNSVSVAGIIAPGNSIDQLDLVAAAATISGNWVTEYSGISNTIDRLDVAGALDLTGGTLTFSDLGSGDPLDNSAYVFGSYTSLTGTPSLVGVPAGYTVDFNFNSSHQIALVAVPEPAALWLFSLGVVGLGGFRVRRRVH